MVNVGKMSLKCLDVVFILHPYIHSTPYPSPEIISKFRIFEAGCRKCSFFLQNFFLGGGMQKWAVYWIESRMEIENIGLL